MQICINDSSFCLTFKISYFHFHSYSCLGLGMGMGMGRQSKVSMSATSTSLRSNTDAHRGSERSSEVYPLLQAPSRSNFQSVKSEMKYKSKNYDTSSGITVPDPFLEASSGLPVQVDWDEATLPPDWERRIDKDTSKVIRAETCFIFHIATHTYSR